MATFLTSDLHCYHKNIIKYCSRPFSDIEEMNAALIENWNSVVCSGDTVWFLGDFSFTNIEKSQEIFNQLAGTKKALYGNHDGSHKRLLEIGFDSVSDFLYYGNNIYLCHFYSGIFCKPHVKLFLSQIPKGGILLHGHAHNPPQSKITKSGIWTYDVGVDANNFTPVNLETVIQEIKDYK